MNRPLAALPSVDRLLRQAESQALIARHGRPAVTEAIRAVLADLRAAGTPESDEEVILARVVGRIERETQPLLRPVFNLTGTVLHTNLGRAQLPEAAIEAMSEAARGPVESRVRARKRHGAASATIMWRRFFAGSPAPRPPRW